MLKVMAYWCVEAVTVGPQPSTDSGDLLTFIKKAVTIGPKLSTDRGDLLGKESCDSRPKAIY